MRKLIIVFLVLTFQGCFLDRHWQVYCDSGFTTGISNKVFITDGVISWDDKGSWKARKMLSGEICEKKRIYNAK